MYMRTRSMNWAGLAEFTSVKCQVTEGKIF